MIDLTHKQRLEHFAYRNRRITVACLVFKKTLSEMAVRYDLSKGRIGQIIRRTCLKLNHDYYRTKGWWALNDLREESYAFLHRKRFQRLVTEITNVKSKD